MPLQHLLYRCPECGHDPAESTVEGARCPGCGARFSRATGASIRVRNGENERIATAPELVDAIDRWEEKAPSGFVDGELDYGARVRFRRAVGQGTARERGQVSGFYEEFTERVPGNLRASRIGLTLRGGAGSAFEWGWGQIRAVQTSSRSVQLNVHPEGLFDLAFDEDSPRRWEGLIHRALRRHYGSRGLEILEFQPRIVTPGLVVIFYAVVRHIIGFSWRLWLKISIEGEHHIPKRGPFILLMNHQSMLDPLLIHSLAPRQIFSMTKSTQFRHPVMRWLLAHLGGFPTRRYQVDPQAVRVALRYLEEGRGVGIFPEGERSWDARLQPLRRGTVRLVLKAGVPVIPVGLVGAYDAWPRWSDFHWLRPFVRRAPITIRFGEPMEFGKHDSRPEREARLQETMETLTRALTEVSRT